MWEYHFCYSFCLDTYKIERKDILTCFLQISYVLRVELCPHPPKRYGSPKSATRQEKERKVIQFIKEEIKLFHLLTSGTKKRIQQIVQILYPICKQL